jgi:hypothetical protein
VSSPVSQRVGKQSPNSARRDAALCRIASSRSWHARPSPHRRAHVYLCVAEEPVDEIVPGWPQPSLDGDAQLDAYGGRHQPDEGIFEVRCEFLGTRLAEDDRYGS